MQSGRKMHQVRRHAQRAKTRLALAAQMRVDIVLCSAVGSGYPNPGFTAQAYMQRSPNRLRRVRRIWVRISDALLKQAHGPMIGDLPFEERMKHMHASWGGMLSKLED